MHKFVTNVIFNKKVLLHFIAFQGKGKCLFQQVLIISHDVKANEVLMKRYACLVSPPNNCSPAMSCTAAPPQLAGVTDI